MNRFLTLIACIFVLSVLPSHAADRDKKQSKWEKQPYKFEVRAGWATPNSNLYYYSVYDTPAFQGADNYLDWIYKPQHGNLRSTGAFFAEFNMNFRRWFALSLTASVSGYTSDVYSPVKDEFTDNISGTLINIMPVARFYMISRPIFRMYGAVGLGIMMDVGDSGFMPYPSFQITPIGVAVGRDVFGFCELVSGVENNASGFYFGIGYRF